LWNARTDLIVGQWRYPLLVEVDLSTEDKEQFSDVLWKEAFQARPQADVPRVGCLSLQADEVFDHVKHGQLRALQQHLPFQRSAVERPSVEHFGRPAAATHRAGPTVTSGVPPP